MCTYIWCYILPNRFPAKDSEYLTLSYVYEYDKIFQGMRKMTSDGQLFSFFYIAILTVTCYHIFSKCRFHT